MFKSVLVLGAEPRIAVSIARSLNRRDISVDVAALSRNDVRLSSKALRKFTHLQNHKGGSPDIIGDLIRLIELNQYSMLIPCSDTALIEVVRHYGRLESIVKVCSPEPEIIKRVLNKNDTLSFAQNCGIPIPVTYRISKLSELRALRHSIRYPLIAKPLSKREPSRFKVLYFYNFKEIENAFFADPLFGSNTLFQEYCEGEGVGIGTYIHNGKPIAIYQHRRLKEYPSTGGVSVLAISEKPEPMLVRYSTHLLNAIGWEGIALVEFRFNRKDRKATLMEINGRYWGSIASAIHSGVDFPFYEWQIAHQQQLNVPSRYRTGLRVRWIAGDIRRLHELLSHSGSNSTANRSRWGNIIEFISDFRPSVRHMLLSYSDPIPAIIEISNISKSLFIKSTMTLINRNIPLRVRTFVKTFQHLDPYEKMSYSLSKIKRFFFIPKIKISKNSKENFRIIFLCHGNIIRSPMAEELFKQKASTVGLKNLHVSSAGIHAKQCAGADPRSITVAQEFGVNLSHHRAQRITKEIIENADAIFVMDSLNEAKLLDKYPEAWKKLFLLSLFCQAGQLKKGEIDDPYKGGIDEIRLCYYKVRSCVHHLVLSLAEGCK